LSEEERTLWPGGAFGMRVAFEVVMRLLSAALILFALPAVAQDCQPALDTAYRKGFTEGWRP